MSIRNLIFGVNSVTVSDLIRYDSLLQNATDVITKCDSYFITKCDKSLLQNALGFLLQNAKVLLQNATVIRKCDVYYKLRQYKHAARMQKIWAFETILKRDESFKCLSNQPNSNSKTYAQN